MRRRSRAGPLGALALLALASWVLWQGVRWPDVGALAEQNPETTAFIARYERSSGGEADWRWLASSRISPHLKCAVLVAEDIDFFSHQGFAPREMRNALRARLEGRPLRGASTLSQQLAKNLWLTPSRHPWRKLKEAILTVQLERRLSKHRILELYLNVVEFAPGVYGAEAASRRFFARSAGDLTERQAAELAAGLPRPRRWYPGSRDPDYRRRVETILRRMSRARWLRQLLPTRTRQAAPAGRPQRLSAVVRAPQSTASGLVKTLSGSRS